MQHNRLSAAAIVVTAAVLNTQTAAPAPARPHEPRPAAATRSDARRLLVRYFDAIRDDDKATACALYRVHGCGTRGSFKLQSYELDVLHRLHAPAEGDWAALVYLHAPDPGDVLPRPVAVAIAVVTCRPTCHITGFYGLAGR
jgi:hypothetical protein